MSPEHAHKSAHRSLGHAAEGFIGCEIRPRGATLAWIDSRRGRARQPVSHFFFNRSPELLKRVVRATYVVPERIRPGHRKPDRAGSKLARSDEVVAPEIIDRGQPHDAFELGLGPKDANEDV